MTENTLALANDPFLSMVERIALSPEANVENIERLYALREKVFVVKEDTKTISDTL